MTNWRGRNKGDEPLPQETPNFYTPAVQYEAPFGAQARGASPDGLDAFYRFGAPTPYSPVARQLNAPLSHGVDLPSFRDWPAMRDEVNWFKEKNPAMITPGTPENDQLQEWNKLDSMALWPGRYAEPSGEDIIRALMMAKAQQK